MDLLPAIRALRSGDPLEDGRADPGAKTISGMSSHPLIIGGQGKIALPRRMLDLGILVHVDAGKTTLTERLVRAGEERVLRVDPGPAGSGVAFRLEVDIRSEGRRSAEQIQVGNLTRSCGQLTSSAALEMPNAASTTSATGR